MARDADAPRIGLNLLVLTERPPGGTGHHAISLFEALVEAETRGSTRARITGFAIAAAARHFSLEARARLVPLPGGGAATRMANEMLRLPRAAAKAGIDVLVNPAFFGAPWGRVKRALIIHDLYFRSAPRLVPPRRRALLRAIVPLLARRSHAIFTVSQATKSELERYYPQAGAKAHVLHNGNRSLLGPGETAGGPPVDAPYLLMVGHLTANKSPETVVRALAILREAGRDLVLVHVGDDAGRLAPLAATAGLSDRIMMLGPQSDAVLAACYAHCEALVIPSLHEGFGLPLIEAQAHGAPVVASDCDALVEVGGRSALYFPVASPQECAQAVASILDDRPRRDALVERGFENAARFRWDLTAERLLEVLDRL